MVASAYQFNNQDPEYCQDAPWRLSNVSNLVVMHRPSSMFFKSLMSNRLDDIEDGSSLRRGYPATHTVFGVNRTINAANLVMFKAVKAAASLSPDAANILTDRIIEGHLGQGLDLQWTFHTELPTEEEYYAMVDGSKLESPSSSKHC